MMKSIPTILILLALAYQGTSLIPPKFQWKTLDFAFKDGERESAIKSGMFIPNNNMPTGLARWKDKLFITIPRWKKGELFLTVVPILLLLFFMEERHLQFLCFI